MKRMTRQRQAILECFKTSNGPLSVEEILKIAANMVPHLNLATVYRNLKLLVAEKTIATVELPGNNTRYELIGLSHHHHFHCHDCNRLFDVDGCPEGIASLVPQGFKLMAHAITLSGHCVDCTKKHSMNY
jgi:Fur family transcriptional regulator, ferric uptake regulator